MIAVLAALTLSAAMLTSCGSTDSSSDAASIVDSAAAESSADSESGSASGSGSGSEADASSQEEIPEPSLTIDGEKIDTTDIVMCTVDGEEIGFDMFRYYYFYVMKGMGITEEMLAEEELFKSFMDAVELQFKRDYTTIHLAKENGIVLDDEHKKNIDDKIAQIKSGYDDEAAYETDLKRSYLTEAVYRRMLEIAELYSMVEETLLTNDGKYATSKEDFKKIVQDNNEYSRVIHILVPYYSQAEITDEETNSSYEGMSLAEKSSAKQTAYNALSEEDQEKVKAEAKKVADEVLKKAKDGEDFSKLITEYGWDPGMEASPDGYYINKESTFVEEFKNEAFRLKENEISDLIENTSFGWFIIKRLPVDMDYVEKNIKNMILEYDTPKINEMFNELVENMEFKGSEYFEKLKADSIT